MTTSATQYTPATPLTQTNSQSMLSKVYDLARPYGRKKLAVVFGIVLLQGVFQVIGVTSIFPFLALASDPGGVRESEIGARVLSELPDLSDRTMLICAGVFSIAMLILSNGLLLLGEVARVRYAEGLGHWLRERLLARIAINPYGYFLQRNTGELLKKAVGDVTLMVRGVVLPALDGTSRLITVTLLLITLLVIDPLIACVAALILGGFYVVVFRLLRNRRQHHSNRMNAANRGAMREAQQLLGGIKPIKIHQSEDNFVARYRSHSSEQAVLRKWIPVYQNTPRYLIEPLAFGGMIALIILLAAQGESLATLLPKLGVMALAGYRLLPNLQLLYGSASMVSMNRFTIDEVHEEFYEAAVTTPTNASKEKPEPLVWSGAIRVEDLSFQYPGTATSLFDGLSIQICKNQFVALVGATGSGKSTLVDLILGLHAPDAGGILIDETRLTAETLPGWRTSLGYVPQEIFLLDDTIAANIAFGVSANKIDLKRVAEVARIAQIADFIETELPDRYQTRVGERGVRLSGGQRQRIGLARALYHDPSTLVLDEATSALDDTTESALMEAIEALHGEITLIVIAHRLSTIQRADRVFVLDHGKVIRQGRFDEVQGNDITQASR
ncbi:MAG: ABC transporter ATP-binding protein [Rhodopirellula sp. JB053]